MKYCIHCGSGMSDEAEFCGNCGKSVDKATPAKAAGKKVLVIGVGMILIAIVAVVVFFTTGVFRNNDHEEIFKEIFVLTEEELAEKYEEQLMTLDDTKASGNKYNLYIDNYKVQGLEGRLQVRYREDEDNTNIRTLKNKYGEIGWAYGIPKGKTLNDYEDEIHYIIGYFTELYGEADISESYEDGYAAKYRWGVDGGDATPHYTMRLKEGDASTKEEIAKGMDFSGGGISISYWGVGGEISWKK